MYATFVEMVMANFMKLLHSILIDMTVFTETEQTLIGNLSKGDMIA